MGSRNQPGCCCGGGGGGGGGIPTVCCPSVPPALSMLCCHSGSAGDNKQYWDTPLVYGAPPAALVTAGLRTTADLLWYSPGSFSNTTPFGPDTFHYVLTFRSLFGNCQAELHRDIFAGFDAGTTELMAAWGVGSSGGSGINTCSPFSLSNGSYTVGTNGFSCVRIYATTPFATCVSDFGTGGTGVTVC